MNDRDRLLRQLDSVARQLTERRREIASYETTLNEARAKLADLEKTRDAISRELGLIP